MTMLGQAASCPQGIPQAACDFVANAQNTGAFPNGLDPSNALTTFKQWYVAATGQAPPSDPLQYAPGNQASNILAAALAYWTTFASQNASASTQTNPSAWTFPLQYVPQASQDAATAVLGAVLAMLANPTAAATMNQGQLPPFDPTQINWAAFGNPAQFQQLANGIAQMVPIVQKFVQLGAQCKLFSQPASVVQNAFMQYMTFGGNPNDPRGNPCALVTGATGATGPAAPPSGGTGATGPAPAPVTIQGQVQTPTPTWVPIAVAVGGAAVVGTLLYVVLRKPADAHENPVGYAGWHAATANQLINRYGVPYHAVSARRFNYKEAYHEHEPRKNRSRMWRRRMLP
jgi:hypothetical protein